MRAAQGTRDGRSCSLPFRCGEMLLRLQGLSWSVVGKQQLEDSWLIENTVSQVCPAACSPARGLCFPSQLPRASAAGSDMEAAACCIQTKTGFLLQLFRTGLGTVYQTWSSDYGASWTDPIPTTLPNPNSKVRTKPVRA